jgi:hypothetical protein
MEPSYINVVAALSFVIVSIIVTMGLFYIEEDKKNLYNNKNIMQQDNSTIDRSNDSDEYNEIQNKMVNYLTQASMKQNSNGMANYADPYSMKQNNMVRIAVRNQPISIEENDRIKFITKCNHVDKELKGLLSKQMILYNRDQKHILMEKRLYINKIRDIVNDLAFTNKREFEQLYTVLKEIQKDVMTQNTRISDLEKKVSNEDHTKNELTNMLIQRMIHESSKKSLQRPNLSELLKDEVNDKEDELKLLEKYIIKTIRKQVGKEKEKVPEQSQGMNPVYNMELHRKSELMDIMNQKLISMENLYKNINSNKKKEIVAIVKEPVKQAVRSYIRVEEAKPKCSKKKVLFSKDSLDLSSINNDMKVLRKDGEANAYYVSN